MKRKIAAVLLFAAVLLSAADYKLNITTDKPAGYYNQNEPIVYQFEVTGKDGKPADADVTATIKSEGQADRTETVKVTGGKAQLKIMPVQPGWTLVRGVIQTEMPPAAPGRKPSIVRKSNVMSAGAISRQDEIRRGADMPEDFDAFWDAEIAKLKKVPMNPRLREIQHKNSDRIGAWEVTLDCVGPRPASGYLAMPRNAKPKSLPLFIQYDGAGIHQATPPIWYADVAICLTFNKYGIPNDRALLKDYLKSDIDGYETNGCDDRDKVFFKWMILRNLRGQEFAKSLPEWNGKVMIINGESLGGGQALICGALDPDVTFINAMVPALCDHNAELKKRTNGWPNVLNQLRKAGADEAKIKKSSLTVGYVDAANFMHRLNPKTEVSIGTGLLDTLCPPSSVIAAYNEIPKANVKYLWTNPKAGHGAGNEHAAKRIFEIIGKI